MGAEVSQRIEGGFVFYMEMKNNNTHAVKLFHNSSFHISLTGSGWRNGDKKHNSNIIGSLFISVVVVVYRNMRSQSEKMNNPLLGIFYVYLRKATNIRTLFHRSNKGARDESNRCGLFIVSSACGL